MLDLLEVSILERDHAFDIQLGEALGAHRAFWRDPERSWDLRGMIALPALAVAQDARARGLPVRMTSPYLPPAVFVDHS